MKSFALLLDTRPEYHAEGSPPSVLLAPLGPATVLRYLGERLSALGHTTLTVATAFEPEPDYVRRIERSGAAVDGVVSLRALPARVADYEPSDWLVLADPQCVPALGLEPEALAAVHGSGPRRAQHLVALETHAGGITERVQLLDAQGTVGRIRRYYDVETWPFTTGVACSVLPVSCLLGASETPFGSLRELRGRLAARGVPASDVFVRGGAFDLSKERDLLALSERVVLDYFAGPQSAGGWLAVGEGCQIDGTARLLGPIVLQSGSVIGAGATVVGPAVVGAGARVEREALVAQCVVGPDAVVAPGLTLRHRAVFGAHHEAGPPDACAPVYTFAPPADPAEAADQAAPPAAAYAFVKAVFDAAASALGLLLLSPLLLLIAVLIKLESRGPVFYRDRREGQGGRAFPCLKFRTMFAGSEARQRELQARNEMDGPQFKLAHDPRVTRLGRLLRRFSLDELPQLVNVLRLEMSLVGPRPSPFRENQLCVPWRDARLSVRPGITGLWQVCRHQRLQGDFHQWIHFDLLYVRHKSFLVDLKILAATVLTLAGQWPAPASWILPLRREG